MDEISPMRIPITMVFPPPSVSHATLVVFDEFDKTRTGRVPISLVGEMMKTLGEAPTLEDLEDAAIILDVEKNGHAPKTQFVDWCVQYRQVKRDARSVADQNRLIDARRSRQMTERDAELLRNRIHLLEREERRTLKRISEANRKAALMYERKKNANSKYIERHKFRSRRMKEMRTCREQNMVRKELSRAAKVRAESNMMHRKIKSANDVKSMSRNLAERKRRMEKEISDRNRRNHISVVRQRQRHLESKLKREQRRQEESEVEYRAKVVDEHVLQRMKRVHLSHLEEREASLIRRVENVRIMQTDALEGLCSVVATSPTDASLRDAGVKEKPMGEANR